MSNGGTDGPASGGRAWTVRPRAFGSLAAIAGPVDAQREDAWARASADSQADGPCEIQRDIRSGQWKAS